jgi:hypothetical protein
MDGADLRLGNAVRTPEVEFDGGCLTLLLLEVLEDGVDFLLRELAAQISGSWAIDRQYRPNL